MNFGIKFLVIGVALSCAACNSQTPSNGPLAVDMSSPNVISGPAPVPTPGSQSRPIDYSQDSGGAPTMANDNPDSGLTLGRSRSF
jgi:hypothetical protein